MSLPEIVTGRIALTEPGAAPVAYERFTITTDPDGGRTLRTVTRSPRGGLLRDVRHEVDATWHCHGGHVRLFLNGACQGQVLRRVAGDRMHSWFWSADGATPDYASFDWPRGSILGFHPVCGDGWKTSRLASAPGDQTLSVHTVSDSWNGSSLGHGVRVESRASWLGQRTMTVPAGQFLCDGFVWHTSRGDVLHIWRATDLNILVELEVVATDAANRQGTRYTLDRLERD